MMTWQLHPPPPVHALLELSRQNIPEQHAALAVQADPMPEQVTGAWQLGGPPSGLSSHVSPEQHGAPVVCEHETPLEMQAPASGWGGAQR